MSPSNAAQSCVIYLFPGWILDSKAKYWFACFVTIALGFVLEGIVFARRRSLKQEWGSKYQVRSAFIRCLLLLLPTVTYPSLGYCCGGSAIQCSSIGWLYVDAGCDDLLDASFRISCGWPLGISTAAVVTIRITCYHDDLIFILPVCLRVGFTCVKSCEPYPHLSLRVLILFFGIRLFSSARTRDTEYKCDSIRWSFSVLSR